MKKFILIVVVVLIISVVAFGVYFWNSMQKPLYEPGMVRAGQNLGAPLDPPDQVAGDGLWRVENDIQLRYFSDGQGTNVLIVHGGPGAPFEAPVAGLRLLADRYRFLYYDQRGCGGSTRPFDRFESSNYYQNMLTLDKTLGLGAQVADIERIRRIIGDEQLILIGHSFGGFLASLYAAEFPEHVRALVLVAPAEVLVMPNENSGLFGAVEPLLPEDMRAQYQEYMKSYLNFSNIFTYSEADLMALNAEFVPYYTAAAAAKGFNVPQGTSQASGGWMVQAMYISMGQKHDYRAALKTVNAPVLVIHGDRDLQTEQASRIYVEAFPNAQFQVIQGAGHFVFNDQPEAFARIVGEFLDQ